MLFVSGETDPHSPGTLFIPKSSAVQATGLAPGPSQALTKASGGKLKSDDVCPNHHKGHSFGSVGRWTGEAYICILSSSGLLLQGVSSPDVNLQHGSTPLRGVGD